MNKLVEPQTGLEREFEADRGDLLIRGDVRMCDVNQSSYLTCNPVSILKSAEYSTKKHYLEPCLAQRRHFSPFVVSCEDLLGKEADAFLKRLLMKLA